MEINSFLPTSFQGFQHREVTQDGKSRARGCDQLSYAQSCSDTSEQKLPHTDNETIPQPDQVQRIRAIWIMEKHSSELLLFSYISIQ